MIESAASHAGPGHAYICIANPQIRMAVDVVGPRVLASSVWVTPHFTTFHVKLAYGWRLGVDATSAYRTRKWYIAVQSRSSGALVQLGQHLLGVEWRVIR